MQQTWKILGLAGLILSSLVIWSGPVRAQYFGWNLDQREAAQQQRIHHGVESGALTPQEARKLGKEQRHLQAAEGRMLRDGRLDYRERARLDRMQHRADRHIYREKHDNQVGYPRYGNHNEPRYRHWQGNHQRGHQYGNHYSRRENGSDRRGAFQGNHGQRGRFHQINNRNRRFAWNH